MALLAPLGAAEHGPRLLVWGAYSKRPTRPFWAISGGLRGMVRRPYRLQ